MILQPGERKETHKIAISDVKGGSYYGSYGYYRNDEQFYAANLIHQVKWFNSFEDTKTSHFKNKTQQKDNLKSSVCMEKLNNN